MINDFVNHRGGTLLLSRFDNFHVQHNSSTVCVGSQYQRPGINFIISVFAFIQTDNQSIKHQLMGQKQTNLMSVRAWVDQYLFRFAYIYAILIIGA